MERASGGGGGGGLLDGLAHSSRPDARTEAVNTQIAGHAQRLSHADRTSSTETTNVHKAEADRVQSGCVAF